MADEDIKVVPAVLRTRIYSNEVFENIEGPLNGFFDILKKNNWPVVSTSFMTTDNKLIAVVVYKEIVQQ